MLTLVTDDTLALPCGHTHGFTVVVLLGWPKEVRCRECRTGWAIIEPVVGGGMIDPDLPLDPIPVRSLDPDDTSGYDPITRSCWSWNCNLQSSARTPRWWNRRRR